MSSSARRLASLVLALVAVLGVAGCTVPPPEGAAPLRYRDFVFADTTITKDLVYGQAPVSGVPVDLTMDVYEPAGDTAARRPAIIWAHGGSFAVGSSTSGDVAMLARNFARRGYVAISINYRLLAKGAGCSGGNFSGVCTSAAFAAASDLQTAADYVAAHAAQLRVAPADIAIGGSSAGAVASVIVARTGVTGARNVAAAVSISGGVPPIVKLGGQSTPLLFWHGTADQVVPFAWASANVEALKATHQIAILRDVAGAGHTPFDQYGTDIDEQARNFLYRALRLQSLS